MDGHVQVVLALLVRVLLIDLINRNGDSLNLSVLLGWNAKNVVFVWKGSEEEEASSIKKCVNVGLEGSFFTVLNFYQGSV